MGVMRRTILIGSLVFLAGGCATLTKPLSKPELRQSEKADFKIVAPHLAALMKVQGDLPPRPECPIGFAVLKTSALNAWVSVPSEPRKPLPPVKALGETKEAPPPDPTPPLPPRCHKFDLVLTSAVLVLPRDQLRAVIAHELGHVYLGHIESLYAEQTLRNGAELFVIERLLALRRRRSDDFAGAYARIESRSGATCAFSRGAGVVVVVPTRAEAPDVTIDENWVDVLPELRNLYEYPPAVFERA